MRNNQARPVTQTIPSCGGCARIR